MVKTKFKKAVSLMLAAVMSLTAFTGIGATTAFAAVGEKADVYLVDYPRSGDTNNNGEWGHGNLNYMNGWKGLSTKYTGLRAMGSYSGNIAYCIEPGTGQRTGDTLTEKDENFFNNISPNGTISGDDIRLLIGRILQYGYRGGISTSWKSQNESDANCIAHAYATQILIWETIVGERDAGFNHVSTSGYNAVLECVSTAHPLRSKILSYYNSMVTSVQNHTKVPSFCTRSSGSAKVNELEWNGSKYVATLTDTNGVLGNYNFSANIDGVSFSVSGNKLTVSMEKAPSKEFTITAAKKNGVRRGVVVWSDGIHQNGNGIQDVVTYAQEVSDPVSGFVKMKVSYGSCQIVTRTTESLAVFIPFRVQDIYHENGIYYGQNVISKNMIIADRRQLLNGNSFILGVSGGGKSFAAKGEIENIILSSNADVIIIDPEREYSQLVKALGGEIINISATSPSHINAMDMNKEYGDGANPVILKSEFIMSLCEQLIGGTNLGAKQKSIIDRCTASVYRDYQQRGYTGTVPTLQDFRAELLKQDEPEAKEIALAIELFTHGSLNTFAKPTNVDTDNRLICYDILDLGKQLMPIGMLVVLDSILNRITQNRAKGKQTFYLH